MEWKILNEIFYNNYQWNIAYKFTSDWKNTNLSEAKTIPNPPNRYLADPFVVKKDGNHYCFVEDFDKKKKKNFKGLLLFK